MATGILTKGIKFSYSTTSAGSYTEVPDLQEIPDLGGDVETVEVTTLADGAKRYIKGLVDYGDLEFTFLYDNSTANSSYRILRGLEEAEAVNYFKVTLPDDTEFTFSGQVSTKISGAGTNDAMQFTCAIAVNSAITVKNPA